MDEKEQFIIDWLEKHHHHYVDVLDSDFMYSFAERFQCEIIYMAVGAPKVPLASKTLGSMYKKRILIRFPVGLNQAERGFPKWVYSYMRNPATIA